MSEPTPTNDKLLLDLASAEHDILSFAEHHAMSLDELIDWASLERTRRTLAGLCILADAQTQLLLSRYRLVAATRLIAQVSSEDDNLPAEQVRKACVDLLKIELSRAERLCPDESHEQDEALEALARAMSVPEVSTADDAMGRP